MKTEHLSQWLPLPPPATAVAPEAPIEPETPTPVCPERTQRDPSAGNRVAVDIDMCCAAFGKACDENLSNCISLENAERLNRTEIDDEDCEWDDAALECEMDPTLQPSAVRSDRTQSSLQLGASLLKNCGGWNPASLLRSSLSLMERFRVATSRKTMACASTVPAK